MAQKQLTDAEAANLYGTTDANGMPTPAVTKNNWGPDMVRSLARLSAIGFADLQVYETDDAADAIAVRSGRITIRGTAYTYAGADPAVSSIANNDTTYVYAYVAGGAIAIGSALDATGWPALSHVKLAEVTLAAGVITAIVDRRLDFAIARHATIAPMFPIGTWAIDGDGARTNGAGMVGAVSLTEQAAAYAVVNDGGAQALLSASGAAGGYTANYQLYPDSPADDDAAYFGAAVPFAELALDIDTAAVYSGDALVWEYWNGSAWSALTLAYDGTDSTAQDGLRTAQRDGAISFVPPTDWASTTVNSQAGYWIRGRLGTGANMTTSPTTNSVEHELVAPTTGWKAPCTGRITEVRAVDQASTLHTATDVKFALVNTTTGAHSGELTWAQDAREHRSTGLDLDVAADDILAVLVTQEDGTNEITDPLLELTIELGP